MKKIKTILGKTLQKFNNKGGILRSISILVGGTAFAQLIGILILPILTRVYTPEDFTKYSVFASIVAIISTISCLRLEIAIPMPKQDEQANELLFLSIISSLIISLVCLILLLSNANLFDSLTNNKLAEYKFFIPIAILTLSLSTTFQLWTIRKKRYSKLAKTRVLQSVNNALSQLLLSLKQVGALGLILSYLIQNISGLWSLYRGYKEDIRKVNFKPSLFSLKKTLSEYKNYPLYSTPEALLNVLSSQLPILIIGVYAGLDAAFFMLGIKLLSAPINLIGKATGQVYVGQGAEKYRLGTLKKFTIEITQTLAKISIVPFIIVFLTAPFLVPIVFGKEWSRAGYLISIMVPWFFVQFLTNPVSMALHIYQRQKIAMILQLFGLIIRVGTVLLALSFYPSKIAEFFILSSFIFYSIYLYVVFYVISKNEVIYES